MKTSSKALRIFLGNPGWYLWEKAKAELKLKPRQREFTVDECGLIIGWFSLYNAHKKDRSVQACRIRFQAIRAASRQPVLPAVMSGSEILKLSERPSRTTLYRRGLKANGRYNMLEVERLLK